MHRGERSHLEIRAKQVMRRERGGGRVKAEEKMRPEEESDEVQPAVNIKE